MKKGKLGRYAAGYVDGLAGEAPATPDCTAAYLAGYTAAREVIYALQQASQRNPPPRRKPVLKWDDPTRCICGAFQREPCRHNEAPCERPAGRKL